MTDFKKEVEEYFRRHPLAHVRRTTFGPLDISLYDDHSLAGKPTPLIRLSIVKDRGLPMLVIKFDGGEIGLYTASRQGSLSPKEIKVLQLCFETIAAYRAWTRYRDIKEQGEVLFVNEFTGRIDEAYIADHLAIDTKLGFRGDKAMGFMQFVLGLHLGATQG